MNILEIQSYKAKKQKLSMITCYDYWSAQLLNETSIDILLVGDSLGMVVHGFPDTIPATIDLMSAHVAAVKRGAPKKFIVADLPFLSYRSDLSTNMRGVLQLMQAGAHAIKLEGCEGNERFIQHLVESGVPVMGHLGLTPQSVNILGGFRVQGREESKGQLIFKQAHALEQAGCFSLVLECVPGHLAQEISTSLSIATIGIGAGAGCDGQVLVLHDLLGLNSGFRPKFLRQYLNGSELVKNAIENYCRDVREGRFPSAEETYE